MKIKGELILKTIKENGGLLTIYGDSDQSSFLKKVQKTIVLSTLALGFTSGASNIQTKTPELSVNNSIHTEKKIIKAPRLNDTLAQNTILIGNLENIHNEDVELNSSSKIISKKTQSSLSTLLIDSFNNGIRENIIQISEKKLGIKININDDQQTLKDKLQSSASNPNNSSDIRVRAQTLVFIIANEGLSSNKGLDAQDHLTLGYGYDANQQIKARIASGESKTQAKREVYSQLARVGLDLNQLSLSYNNPHYKVSVSPVQGLILSTLILDDYISYAKKSAGPKLWGLYKDGEIKPADLNRTAWTKEDFEKQGGVFNNYMVLNNRMKSAYTYAVYNGGPTGLGNAFRKQLEKGHIYSAINSISVTWTDKNKQVFLNQRMMNNMALAFSSSYTMKTFTSNESDKYARQEISEALSSESPDITKMLKLQESYSKNVSLMAAIDIKRIKKGSLSTSDEDKYIRIKKQSDGLLKNINQYREKFGDARIKPYSPKDNITDFDKLKNINDDVNKYENDLNDFTQEIIKNNPNRSNAELEKEISSQIPNFDKSEKLSTSGNNYLNKIKKLVMKKQSADIKELKKEKGVKPNNYKV